MGRPTLQELQGNGEPVSALSPWPLLGSRSEEAPLGSFLHVLLQGRLSPSRTPPTPAPPHPRRWAPSGAVASPGHVTNAAHKRPKERVRLTGDPAGGRPAERPLAGHPAAEKRTRGSEPSDGRTTRHRPFSTFPPPDVRPGELLAMKVKPFKRKTGKRNLKCQVTREMGVQVKANKQEQQVGHGHTQGHSPGLEGWDPGGHSRLPTAHLARRSAMKVCAQPQRPPSSREV